MYESGDPQPSSGFFYRGDQFSFAKAGVPGVWAQTGNYLWKNASLWQEQTLLVNLMITMK